MLFFHIITYICGLIYLVVKSGIINVTEYLSSYNCNLLFFFKRTFVPSCNYAIRRQLQYKGV